MTLFLIIAPFGAFGLLMLLTSASVSLFVGAAIALGQIAVDAVRGRTVKLFTASTVIILGSLGAYLEVMQNPWSDLTVRLAVDGGVIAVALLSLAIRQPFTLQYAREMVEPELLSQPGFVKANYVLTWVWTGAFALMLLANAFLIYSPNLPLWIGFAVALAARHGAIYFTRWYPKQRRAAATSAIAGH